MSGFDQSKIRNFCIIAHIDHGKSTLADRLLETTGRHAAAGYDRSGAGFHGAGARARHHHQVQGRAHALHAQRTGRQYELNLIDTPGHVDFTYEVSRALAACEGAILVVDASQGIEAQTLANVYMALEHDLEILPVINKIDLPSARPGGREAARSRTRSVWIPEGCPLVSAKQGIGIDDVLEAMVNRVPAPSGRREGSAAGADFRFLLR